MMRRGEVTVRVATDVSQGWVPLRLPVARVMPEDADASTPFVLLGGHIDAWYYGGTDEGASNAAMVEMAIAFNENRDLMRRGLVVAWWPGHSNARYGGSTWFADRYFAELRSRGVAYLNIDGVGQRDAKTFSTSASPALATLGRRVVEGLTSEQPQNARPGRNSDQAFNGMGVPLLQFNHARLAADGGYWWWHTPDDTYDKINFDILDQDTDLYMMAIAHLTADARVPLDLVGEVEALSDALRVRQQESASNLDLAEALEAAGRLDRVVRSVTELARRAPPSSEVDAATQAVLRPIHRIMFVPGSDHHPDPGVYGSPLPGLEPARILAEETPDSDRYGFALAQLIRERNRILEAIAESMHAVDDLERLVVRLVG
jgi:aminopeptidase YwaD